MSALLMGKFYDHVEENGKKTPYLIDDAFMKIKETQIENGSKSGEEAVVNQLLNYNAIFAIKLDIQSNSAGSDWQKKRKVPIFYTKKMMKKETRCS